MSSPEPQPGTPQEQSPNDSAPSQQPRHVGSVPIFAQVNHHAHAAAATTETGTDTKGVLQSLSLSALVVGAAALAVISTAVGGLIGYLTYSG